MVVSGKYSVDRKGSFWGLSNFRHDRDDRSGLNRITMFTSTPYSLRHYSVTTRYTT